MMTTDTDESGLRLFPVQPVLQDDRVPAGLSVSELARSRKVSSPAAAAISLLSPTKQRSNTESSSGWLFCFIESSNKITSEFRIEYYRRYWINALIQVQGSSTEELNVGNSFLLKGGGAAKIH